MSSNEDETKAASVLSQMSKSTKQASENVTTQQIDNNSVIAHQCDVETTTSQGKLFFRVFLHGNNIEASFAFGDMEQKCIPVL